MKIEDRPIVHEQQNINIAEKAKEAGFEVSEEDLAGVSGGSFIKNIVLLDAEVGGLIARNISTVTGNTFPLD